METTGKNSREFSISEEDRCLCGQEGCVGHEIIDEIVQVPGFTSRLAAQSSPHEVIVFDVPLGEATYGKGELSPDELAAHPGPFLVRWLPL